MGLISEKPKNPKYIPKKYEQMLYPGQRVQVDVKHVPSACLTQADAEGTKYYQYTAPDEFSGFRYVEAFEELSTYSSSVFAEHMKRAFPFIIECVQTDNGSEFTNALQARGKGKFTAFENKLAELGITHKRIRPYTPRHNGKVERSHRKDNEYFYAVHKFYSFTDFKNQLYIHNKRYNCFPMRPLGWKSPAQTLFDFLRDGVTYV
jgi:transposase InsO family protein